MKYRSADLCRNPARDEENDAVPITPENYAGSALNESRQ